MCVAGSQTSIQSKGAQIKFLSKSHGVLDKSNGIYNARYWPRRVRLLGGKTAGFQFLLGHQQV